MKVAFFTLGCKVNQYESQEMLDSLIAAGFTPVDAKEEADVYVVNSCTVTAESSRKSKQMLRKFRQEHPDAVTVLTGCFSQAFANEAENLSEADIILGNKTNKCLLQSIEMFFNTRERIFNISKHEKTDAYTGGKLSTFDGHTRAFIKIQDGCNRYCTYCIIPKSRGFSRSKPLETIKDEVEALAKNGYKELVFVGINLSAYGLDINKNICDALNIAEKTDGIERIRLGSLEPDHITNDVIKQLSNMKKFCPQFHLSLQSGCDRILKRMNRHYSAAEYAALCTKLKEVFPALSLTTDIIVGFPGETDDDFYETVEYVKKIGFLKVHVFPFSPRAGTPAAGYGDKVCKNIQTKRCEFLQNECDKIREEFMRSYIGKTKSVLFETPKDGAQHGYTKNYIPVSLKTTAALNGQIKNVLITAADENGCTGILCE